MEARREKPSAALKGRELAVVSTYHPSRQALFHPDPAERQRRVDRRPAAFREVAEILAR